MLTCKLTSPELRNRKEQVIAVLRSKVPDKREVDSGFEYQFESTDEMLDQLTAFIKSERLCFDFFDFTISLKGETFWLAITAPVSLFSSYHFPGAYIPICHVVWRDDPAKIQ